HERFDGTGYPYGLNGEAISLGGQMAAIADVFDALTSDRCYRNGIDQVEVLRKLYGWSRSHFNEDLVHRFIRCIGIYPAGTLVQLQSGMLGVVVESTDSLLRPVVRLVYDTKRDWAVSPKDIDLSKPNGKGGEERIIGYECAKRWRINPLKVLGIT
ncbi:MAG: phosphodiesterase, partial [Proteobacteria bacterium]|nr:phosphodiesterase [Pseudomonadota bacterium]